VCWRCVSRSRLNCSRVDSWSFLQPYRNHKLGAQGLQLVADAAAASPKPEIDHIYLHVQSNNEDAIRFYEKHGFVKTELVQDYYKRLQPRDAWILKRNLKSSS
jgi:N-alpha-acetyltransferase 50